MRDVFATSKCTASIAALFMTIVSAGAAMANPVVVISVTNNWSTAATNVSEPCVATLSTPFAATISPSASAPPVTASGGSSTSFACQVEYQQSTTLNFCKFVVSRTQTVTPLGVT